MNVVRVVPVPTNTVLQAAKVAAPPVDPKAQYTLGGVDKKPWVLAFPAASSHEVLEVLPSSLAAAIAAQPAPTSAVPAPPSAAPAGAGAGALLREKSIRRTSRSSSMAAMPSTAASVLVGANQQQQSAAATTAPVPYRVAMPAHKCHDKLAELLGIPVRSSSAPSASRPRERGKGDFYVLKSDCLLETQPPMLPPAQLASVVGLVSSAPSQPPTNAALDSAHPIAGSSPPHLPSSVFLAAAAANSSPTEPTALRPVFDSISGDLARRRSVLVMIRGGPLCGKSAFFERFVSSATTILIPVFDRAILAYQDQRTRELELASEQDNASSPSAGANSRGGAGQFTAFSDAVAPSALQPSALTQDGSKPFMRKRSPQRPRTADAAGGRNVSNYPNYFDLDGFLSSTPRARFWLYSADHLGPRPPPKPEHGAGALTARTNDDGSRRGSPNGGKNSPTTTSNRRGIMWGNDPAAQGDGTKGDSAATEARNKAAAMAHRRSSVKLRQNLAALIQEEQRSVLSLKAAGSGQTWRCLAFSTLHASYVALPPLSSLDQFIKSMRMDFWYKFDSNLEGDSHPQTVIHLAENNRSEIGFGLHVGFNFAAAELNNEPHLRLMIRDVNNRTLEAAIVLDVRLCDAKTFHHCMITIKSLEDAVVWFHLDGVLYDRVHFVQVERPAAFPVTVNRQGVNIGGLKDHGSGQVLHPFNGSIRDVRFWRQRDLSDDVSTKDAALRNEAALSLRLCDGDVTKMPVKLLAGVIKGGSSSSSAAGGRQPVPPAGSKPGGAKIGANSSSVNVITNTTSGGAGDSSEGKEAPYGGMRWEPVAYWTLSPEREGDVASFQDRIRVANTTISVTSATAAAVTAPGSGPSNPHHHPPGQQSAAVGGGGVPVVHGATIVDLPAPTAAPSFEGWRTVMSSEVLAQVGEYLSSFSLELRFRTTVTHRMMCLVGVQDSQKKQSEVMIILNAEPVSGQYGDQKNTGSAHGLGRLKYVSYSLTVVLSDSTGRSYAGCVRFNERFHVCDGEWHTLQWRMIDAEANRAEIRVDGAAVDVVSVIREGPRQFINLQCWLCLGGLNIRNWRVSKVFEGSIKAFKASIRGDVACDVHFNQGCGAALAPDLSGHGFHVLFIDATTLTERRHALVWLPLREEASQATAAELEEKELAAAEAVRLFNRNDVRVALVCVTATEHPQTHKPVETIYDLMHTQSQLAQLAAAAGTMDGGMVPSPTRAGGGSTRGGKSAAASSSSPSQKASSAGNLKNAAGEFLNALTSDDEDGEDPALQPLPTIVADPAVVELELRSSSAPNGLAGRLLPGALWTMLPPSVFIPVEKAMDVHDILAPAVSDAKTRASRHGDQRFKGHYVAIIALGDAYFTIVDFAGPNIPLHSTYNVTTMKWSVPLSSFGAEAKRAACVDLMVSAAERAIVKASHFPDFALRVKQLPTVEWLRHHLESVHSQPTVLASLLYSLFCDTEFGSRLYNVASYWKTASEDQVAATAMVDTALRHTARPIATMHIQRCIRGMLSRLRYRALRRKRQSQGKKLRVVEMLRASALDTFRPKSSLRAIVIAVTDPHGTAAMAAAAATAAAAKAEEHELEGLPLVTSTDGNQQQQDGESAAAERVLSSNNTSSSGAPSKRLKGDNSGPSPLIASPALGLAPVGRGAPVGSSLLPAIPSTHHSAIVHGLEQQGYSVSLMLNPTRESIVKALKAIHQPPPPLASSAGALHSSNGDSDNEDSGAAVPPSANSSFLVYVVGYGTARYAYPVHSGVRLLDLNRAEWAARDALIGESEKIVSTAVANAKAAMQATLAAEAAKAAKKGGGGGRGRPQSGGKPSARSASTTAPSPGANATPAGRSASKEKVQADSTGKKGKKKASSAQSGPTPLQLQQQYEQRELMAAETELRASELIRPFETERAVIINEFVTARRLIVDFEKRYVTLETPNLVSLLLERRGALDLHVPSISVPTDEENSASSSPPSPSKTVSKGVVSPSKGSTINALKSPGTAAARSAAVPRRVVAVDGDAVRQAGSVVVQPKHRMPCFSLIPATPPPPPQGGSIPAVTPSLLPEASQCLTVDDIVALAMGIQSPLDEEDYASSRSATTAIHQPYYHPPKSHRPYRDDDHLPPGESSAPPSAPPKGAQVFVAIDLLPVTSPATDDSAFATSHRPSELSPADLGLGLLAASNSKARPFFYAPNQKLKLSWSLGKALRGAIPGNRNNKPEAILLGGVPQFGMSSNGGSDAFATEAEGQDTSAWRDAQSLMAYLAQKLEREANTPVQALAGDLDTFLDEEAPYNGDLVPLRVEPSTAQSRAQDARVFEGRKVSGNLLLAAVSADRSAADIQADLRSVLPANVTAADVTSCAAVLFSFYDPSTGAADAAARHLPELISRLDVAAVNAQLQKTCDPGVTILSTPCTYGLLVEVQGTTAAERGRAIRCASQIAMRAGGQVTFSVKGGGGSTSAAGAATLGSVELLYLVKVTTNAREWKRLTKRLLFTGGEVGSVGRLLQATLD